MLRFFALLWLVGLALACTNRQTTTESQHTDTSPPVAAAADTSALATAPAKTTAVFGWQTELCDFKGIYDAGQHTDEQLKNTVALWFSPPRLETTTTVFKPANIGSLDTLALDLEYKDRMASLRALKIVKLPYWLSLKQRVIRDFEQTYQLARLQIRAYTNPTVLLNTPFSATCNRYAEAVNADETTLMDGWKALADERNRTDGNAAGSGEMYYGNYKPAERFSYARVDIITFGWTNCANEQIDHVNRTEDTEREFAKLFTNIQSKCDEP
jgi:hypothetical protein